jgi:hypothetical protein
MKLPLLIGLLGSLSPVAVSSAFAADNAAEDCVRTKVWDDYADRWGIRSVTTTTLEGQKVKVYAVPMYKGNEYRIRACADAGSKDVSIALYDEANGPKDAAGNPQPVTKDDSTSREPVIEFTPTVSGTYHIVVRVSEYANGKTSSSVALAVTYR